MGNNALSCNVVRNLIVVQRTVMCLLTIVCLWCPFTLYAQFNVREGKTTCDVYVYKFKRGKPDTANKTLVQRDTYNSRGHTLETIYYADDGSIKSKVVNKYDEQGRQLESAEYEGENTLISKVTSIYDVRGSEIERTYFFNEEVDTYIFKYDSAGRKTETIEYGIGGIKRLAYSVEPKGEGFLRITIWFNPDGSIASKHLRDDFGFYIESVAYGKRGDPEKKTEYKYY